MIPASRPPYTPPPWITDEEGQDIHTKEGKPIAYVYEDRKDAHTRAESRANARLVMQAPRLMEALVGCDRQARRGLYVRTPEQKEAALQSILQLAHDAIRDGMGEDDF